MNLSHEETAPSTRGCGSNPGSCTHRPRTMFLNLAFVLSPALMDPLLPQATPALAPEVRDNTSSLCVQYPRDQGGDLGHQMHPPCRRRNNGCFTLC